MRSGKACVIVGAGAGVSMGVARKFGREGFVPVLVARKAEALEGYVSELKEAGIAEAYGFAGDASDFEGIKATFAKIKEQVGEISVLHYNAAVLKSVPPSQVDPQDLINEFAVNVAGALACAQQVIPAMKAARQGTILFTGGGLALNPAAAYASLAIGKAGIRSLAYSLGGELESEGIQVATVTITGFVQPGTHFDPDLIAEAFWQLHSQPEGQRQREIVYK